MNRLHASSRAGTLNTCMLAILVVTCMGCMGDSEESTTDADVQSTTNADDGEIQINGTTFRQVDPSSLFVTDDQPVAGAGPGSESTAMPIYLTPWYNAQGPQINVGSFSDELRDATSESILDLADMMKEEWTTLPCEAMFVLAIRLYDLGHKDEAVYWFYSARLRAGLFVEILESESIGGIGSAGFELKHAFGAFIQLSGGFFTEYAFEHPDMLLTTLDLVKDELDIMPEFATIYPSVVFIDPDQWAEKTEAGATGIQQLIDLVHENEGFIGEHGRAPQAFRTFTQPADRQLADSAAVGDIEGVDAAIADGADVNARGSGGQTPLMFVFDEVRYSEGSKEGFEYLLQQGADPNILDEDGDSIIHTTARWNELELLRLCLEHGGDANLRDGRKGITYETADQVIGSTPTHKAAVAGSIETMELLLEYGADINMKDIHRAESPLFDALRFHQPIAAKWLLEHGADWTAQSNDGVGIPEVALHYEFDPQRAPEHAAAMDWIWNFLEEQGVDLVAAEQRSREIFQGNFHRINP